MTLLGTRAATVRYRVPGRGPRGAGVLALDRVDCALPRGAVLGVVGRSGSGKSTLGSVMGGMLRPTAGTAEFEGRDIARLSRSGRAGLRRAVQYVFQDPVASMNPSFTVARVLDDPQRVHFRGDSRAERDRRCRRVLDMVGLGEEVLALRPWQLSGGQAQRVCMARALLPDPAALVCDECTSALDLSVQAQVLNLLRDLRRDRGLAVLFISHDMGAVGYLADEVLVLEEGRAVERGDAAQVMADPGDPVTRGLLDAARGLQA